MVNICLFVSGAILPCTGTPPALLAVRWLLPRVIQSYKCECDEDWLPNPSKIKLVHRFHQIVADHVRSLYYFVVL